LQQITSREPLTLECGEILKNITIGYSTFGKLNDDKTNVVWVFHALTGNSNPLEWWSGLFGKDKFFDPDKYFIVCANMLGSCYGSSQPENFEFPLVTITDMVKAHKILKSHLGIEKIWLGIGGSMGGQQLLEWAVEEPSLFEIIVPLATNTVHSPWGIAFNEAQRMALAHPDPKKGMETARAIGMLSYRHYNTFELTQKDGDHRFNDFSASSYLHYQGNKLSKRFSPFSYFYLSKAMDNHDLGRNFNNVEEALDRIESRCISIGIDTDILFPVVEQKRIAKGIKNSSINIISSEYGHDGFLIETKKIAEIIDKELKL